MGLWEQYLGLSLIHISEPTRLGMISYAVFCLKKKIEEYAKQGIIAKITSPTRRIATHKPIAVCLYLVCTFDSSKKISFGITQVKIVL